MCGAAFDRSMLLEVWKAHGGSSGPPTIDLHGLIMLDQDREQRQSVLGYISTACAGSRGVLLIPRRRSVAPTMVFTSCGTSYDTPCGMCWKCRVGMVVIIRDMPSSLNQGAGVSIDEPPGVDLTREIVA